MGSPARKVNQQLNFAKLLFNAIAYDGSLKDIAVLQSCYLHLELAVLFYLTEISTGKNHRLLEGQRLCSLDQLKDSEIPMLKLIPEFREFVELSKIEASWFSVLVEQIALIRAPSMSVDKKDGLRGDLFVTVESSSENSPSNLISVANIEGSEAREDFLRFECLVRDFQELVVRQRANNEEY